MGTGLSNTSSHTTLDPSHKEAVDPEDDPFRRRLLFLLSLLIIALSLIAMEWWSGYGIECTTDLTCECYPRGIRCWFSRHF